MILDDLTLKESQEIAWLLQVLHKPNPISDRKCILPVKAAAAHLNNFEANIYKFDWQLLAMKIS
ncbi:hypothetical protein D1872_169170 [compost metagenome]